MMQPEADHPSVRLDPAVPVTAAQRRELRDRLRRYVSDQHLTAPLTLDELMTHVVRASDGQWDGYARYAAVLLSNEVWRPVLAAVPNHKRLLLLPQCLRAADCPAEMDEWGYVCAQCGRCPIRDFQAEAIRLGYVTLIAEGSPMVMSLIESGQVEAVIGVSCLATLEKVFPYMQAAAIPGVAIPTISDDCHDGTIDADWIWDAIGLPPDQAGWRLDLDAAQSQAESWFTPDALDALLPDDGDPTVRVAREVLAGGGKRWRPFLLLAAWYACHAGDDRPVPPGVRQLAVAVECFHKASLIHDDIEDGDDLRDGKPALHARYGVPVAINAGDYLLGEGYRLIAQADLPADVRAGALAVAADGHRRLALGQGRELVLQAGGSLADVLAIAEAKTAPAFEVALRLGVLAATASDASGPALAEYSRNLGVAYQLQDDLDDLAGDVRVTRPSAVLAVATDVLGPADRQCMARLREGELISAEDMAALRAAIGQPAVLDPIRQRLDEHLRQAQAATGQLPVPALRALLRRVLSRLFTRPEKNMPCCCDRNSETHE